MVSPNFGDISLWGAEMKYYYDNPLKAAWMNEVFDIQFITPFKHEYDYGENATWVKSPTENMIFVHPDDCDEFKPRPDDLIQIGDLIYWVMEDEKLFYANETRLEHNFKLLKDALIDFDEKLLHIIQRDGQVFFNPYEER